VLDDYNTPLAFSFLEDCRILLSNWAKPILDERLAVLYNGNLDYFRFNTSGYLEHYKKEGMHFVYEVPCRTLALETYVNIYENERRWGGIPNYQTCRQLFWKLLDHVRYYYDGQYWGPDLKFCFRFGFNHHFPTKIEPIEAEFKDYKIRASKFNKNTPSGSFFYSPTLADYLCILRRNTPYVDQGDLEPEYLDDYWTQD